MGVSCTPELLDNLRSHRQNSHQRRITHKKALPMKKETITPAEISRRWAIHKETRACFAVDNIHPNPDTQYIFEAYNNGQIATIEDAIKALDKHYKINR